MNVAAPPPELSVVILGYRAGATLVDLVDRAAAALDAAAVDWEGVLVANYWPGQDDATPAVARALAAGSSRLRALAEPKAGGMGWDLRRGLAAARGQHLAFIDGDGQMPPGDLARVYLALCDEGYDLVKTYRRERADGLQRKLHSWGFNALFSALFPGPDWRDVNSKPKVLTRAAYEQMTLASDGWFIDAEIMLEARRLALRVGELPTVFGALEGRASFVGPRAVLELASALIRRRWRERRGHGGRLG